MDPFRRSAIVALLSALLLAAPALAEDGTTIDPTAPDTIGVLDTTDVPETTDVPDTTEVPDGSEFGPTPKLAGEYESYLGTDSDAVVSGLREGEPIVLSEPAPDGSGTTNEVIIDTPTGKMGWGNVRHSIDLAEYQLVEAGITEPTASELQAALNGGTVTNADGVSTELPGVLTMRSEGMGWGQIAQATGTKLGWVKSGRTPLNTVPNDQTDLTDPTDVTDPTDPTEGDLADGNDGGTPDMMDPGTEGEDIVAGEATAEKVRGRSAEHRSDTASASGVVSGDGTRPGKSGEHGRGHGVVTGGGDTATASSGIISGDGSGHGKSGQHGRGHGVVTGGGDSATASASIVSGSGSSHGGGKNGRGHGIVSGMGGDSSGGSGSVVSGDGSSSGGSASSSLVRAHGNRGSGIVDGFGGSSSGSLVVSGQGHGSKSHGVVDGGGSSHGGGGNGRGGGNGHGKKH